MLPVADTLLRKGIPFVFTTATAEFEDLPAPYNGAPVCRKPANEAELADLLVKLTRREALPGGAESQGGGAVAVPHLLQPVQVQLSRTTSEGGGKHTPPCSWGMALWRPSLTRRGPF